jgi:amino acid permease
VHKSGSFRRRLALSTSYPLHFSALRNGAMDCMKMIVTPPETTSPEGPTNDRFNNINNNTTLALLLVLTVLATNVKDVSFILAFGGATLGNLLCFIYPAIMLAKVSPSHKIPATALAVTGIVFGVLGTTAALQRAM